MSKARQSGIVLELQKDCLDSSVSPSAILRKAKAIASKLGLVDLSAWLDEELNGYKCARCDLPSHRKGGGAPKFWNPYNGWCPIMTRDERLSEILTSAFFPEPIAQLEDWARAKGTLTYRYPHAIQEYLQSSSDFQFEAIMHISPSQITGALDFVRNKVLDWALELEKREIVGDNFTFEDNQREEARAVTNYIYGSNIGVLGGVAGDAYASRFINGSGVDRAQLEDFLSQASQASAGLDQRTRDQVQPILRDLVKEADGKPKPDRVKSLLNSLRQVLEGASGNLVASAIL